MDRFAGEWTLANLHKFWQWDFAVKSSTTKWFFQTLAAFTNAQKMQLLRFVTGSPRLPFGGTFFYSFV